MWDRLPACRFKKIMHQISSQNDTGHANAQFAFAFNQQWLQANLARYLWRENEAVGLITQCEMINTWESSKRTTVHYQISFNDAEGQPRQQMYVGFLVADDRLEDEYKSALKKAKIHPAFGRAAALVPEAKLILLAYPNDRKMSLLSEAQLQAWLGENLRNVAGGALGDENWRVQTAKVEMLRYVPEKRFTAHCAAQIKSENGSQEEIFFIAKQLNDENKARKLYRDLRSLHKAWPENGKKPPIRLPRALALDQKNGVVFIEEMRGDNLKQVLFEIDLPRVMPAVGRLLADFHRTQKRVRKKVTIKNELAEVREAIQTIVKTLPHFRPRLKKLLAHFKAVKLNDRRSPVLLHGTYRLNHIFICDGELALLDLDSLRMGHPAYDIANFLSSLYYLEEAHGRITATMRQEISRHFFKGYVEKMKKNISPAAVLWFLASLLINKQAKKYITHSHDECEEKVGRMLVLAETVLALSRQRPREMALATLWQALP